VGVNEICKYTIDGVVYTVFGEHDMCPNLDESGLRLNTGYDFYDVYEPSLKLGCLTCVNEGYPFYSLPTEKELTEFLAQ